MTVVGLFLGRAMPQVALYLGSDNSRAPSGLILGCGSKRH